jgi:hypothetical protein
MTFSGSYLDDDVTFLLKPVQLAPTSVAEKERLIQSGARHYSEMISREEPPDQTYMELFHRAIERNGAALAADVLCLAHYLAQQPAQTIVLVSLARAGTPIGVLLKRTLDGLGRENRHYSISIIRDRGVDEVALDHITAQHGADSIFFVDGWTGKGAIAGELTTSIARYNRLRGTQVRDALYVVADLAGVAEFAASSDDYLIPCAIMNCLVSGLVSRTILNDDCVGPGDYHACLFYEEYRDLDLSQWFVDVMMERIEAEIHRQEPQDGQEWSVRRESLRRIATEFLEEAMQRYGVRDRNRVKPGVGEATRAILRRVPERLLLRDPGSPDTEHLQWLARLRDVPVEHASWLPYRAAAIIRSLGSDS